jgi:hypothetical protein
MACVTPESQLTEAEQACCRAMAHQCGDMADSNGHSCCQTVVQHHDPALLKSALAPQVDTHVDLIQVEPAVVSFSSVDTIRSSEQPRHPPPGSATPSIEILRI